MKRIERRFSATAAVAAAAAVLAGFLACPRAACAAGADIDEQKARDVQARADAELREKQRRMSAEALAREEIERLDLGAREWRPGTVAMLRGLGPQDVVKMQVFLLAWRPDGCSKTRSVGPFGLEGRDEVAAILELVSRAPEFQPGENVVSDMFDRSLVVQPWKGDPFEIRFVSDFQAPFGDVHSLELKEALYALAGGESRISAAFVRGGEVRRMVLTSAIAPHRGGSSTPLSSAKLRLAPGRGLTLALKVLAGTETVLEDEKPVRYGIATAFGPPGEGAWVVAVYPEDRYWEQIESLHLARELGLR